MAVATQAIRYGWAALASLGVITGVTIYVSGNARHQVAPQDIIELALGVAERCLHTQTQTNPPAYLVDPPAIVRTWTDAGGNDVIVTNTIGWRLDREMMVDLDATIKALVPLYYDENWQPLTVTGLWATLGIGDRTNQFTRTPSMGGSPATFGDYPWQLYSEDLEERYKVLYSMKNIINSNANMMSNGYSYVWYPGGGDVPGVGLVWQTNAPSQKFDGSATGPSEPNWPYGTRDPQWSTNQPSGDIQAALLAAFVEVPIGNEAPASWINAQHVRIWMFETVCYLYYWRAAARSIASYAIIGTFATNVAHSVRVEARSVAYGTWDDSGAFGGQDEWVTIIEELNSFEAQHTSSLYGQTAILDWIEPEEILWPVGFSYQIGAAKGNTTETRLTAVYGDRFPGWVTNYVNEYGMTNALGTNITFLYCTNRYW